MAIIESHRGGVIKERSLKFTHRSQTIRPVSRRQQVSVCVVAAWYGHTDDVPSKIVAPIRRAHSNGGVEILDAILKVFVRSIRRPDDLLSLVERPSVSKPANTLAC